MQRTFDVRELREQFPALRRTHNGRGVVYFDGPGGSQVAQPAIDAVAAALSWRLDLPVWSYSHHFDVVRVEVWRNA